MGGAASNLLHDAAREGDEFEMSMPCGDFTRQEGEEGSVFLGAGIGITALIGMVKEAVKRSEQVRGYTMANVEPIFSSGTDL